MDLTLFIVVLFGLQIACFFVAGKFAKKLKTQDDYFLAGRGIQFFPLLMTLIATQIGGGLVLGSAEEAYQYGWSVLLYPLGACLGLLVLASGIGRRMAQFPVSTVAQLFEVVYQSPKLKKFASLLSIVSLFLILVAQVIASKKFMLTLGVSQNWIFIAFWAIVILYTVMGGLKAVVATDVVQAAFFIFVFILCFLFASSSSEIAINEILATGVGSDFEFNQEKLFGWLLMPLLFMVIEQDMAQRCFAAKSGKIVSLAAGCSAICIMFVCMIPVYFGVLGKTMGIEVQSGSSVLMTVIRETTNPAFTALVGCAILAAIISTADSLINAITSNVAQDFNVSFFTKGNVKNSQKMTAFIAVAAIFGSFYFDNVVDLLMQSYELSVTALFVPILAAIFKNKGNTLSAVLSICVGAFSFFLFRFVSVGIPRELTCLLLSALGFIIGELVSLRQTKAHAYKF